MIADFERFHGVALRSIIASAHNPVTIEAWDQSGRIDSYVVNGVSAIHLKHSSKRLPPWQFTFTEDEISELSQLRSRTQQLWIVLICGSDGLVCLSDAELRGLIGGGTTPFIRVDRDPRSMYRVFGNGGRLRRAKAKGVDEVHQDLTRPKCRKRGR